MSSKLTRYLLLLVILTSCIFSMQATAPAQQDKQMPNLPLPDLSPSRGGSFREASATDKLSPDLQILYGQYAKSRGGEESIQFNNNQLRERFDINGGDADPRVDVILKTRPGADLESLKKLGVNPYFRSGDDLFADVRVLSLGLIAAEELIVSVDAVKAASIPPMPGKGSAPTPELPIRGQERGGPVPKPYPEAAAGGFTGKGAIVGVVDSGIDWTHPDFVRADGTSRVLYLWDLFDDSFRQSKGKIGTQPPVLLKGGSAGPGTVYTNQQINEALKGRGKVNSMDYQGHGTAVAGTAAGNGRASGTSRITGVAPDADLIVVKAGNCGGIMTKYYLGVVWIAQTAQSLRRPVVINLSLGNHMTSHKGDSKLEEVLNLLCGKGKPGVAITAAAGNEGEYSFHASGRFGPLRTGQLDADGTQVEVFISPERVGEVSLSEKVTAHVALVRAFFDRRDDWGVLVRGSGGFLVRKDGEAYLWAIFKRNNQIEQRLFQKVTADNKVRILAVPAGEQPDYYPVLEKFVENAFYSQNRVASSYDELNVPLPPGAYPLQGFSPSAQVVNGVFDLYLPTPSEGAFTQGAIKKQMVATPGMAENVITVAAYNFRSEWVNGDGAQVRLNLELENISAYSNPGGPLDGGRYKPEIAAPATYTISALSSSSMGEADTCKNEGMGMAGNAFITRDKKYIAWTGTSAASPYVAGVIARMFQKNPSLDAAQIKNILTRTATKNDRFVGAVPNPEWGYGKINPAAAVTATPVKAPAGGAVKKRK